MLSEAPVMAVLPADDLERARHFYEEILGLQLISDLPSGYDVYCSGGTRLRLYQRPDSASEHTVAGFRVPDVEAAVRGLRARGVQFMEMETPRTVDGVFTIGTVQRAWFRDSEGNMIVLANMP